MSPPRHPCFIDYRDTYGPEGALYTGESSTAARWHFQLGERRAFSFRVRFSADAGPRPGEVSGVVYSDTNRNGRLDPGEPGLPDVVLAVTPYVGGIGNSIARANAVGRYAYQVREPGRYHVDLVVPTACLSVNPAESVVDVMRGPDGALTGFGRADFGCAAAPGGAAATTTPTDGHEAATGP